MTRRLSFGDDFARVIMDDSIAGMVREVIENTQRPLISLLESEVEKIYQNARDKWPVKSGRSRDSLAVVLEIKGGDAIAAGVVERTPYGHLIKGKEREAGGYGDGGNRQTWRVLLQKPLLEVADEVAGQAAELLVEGG
jgi:hypothetical protein